MPKYTLVHDAEWGEWSALYVDGVLARDRRGDGIVGDTYAVVDELLALLGVERRTSFFLAGGDQREDAVHTLAEVDRLDAAAASLAEQVETMRAEAARLTAEADALDKSR